MAATLDEQTQYIDQSTGALLSGGSLFIGTVDLDPEANPKDIFSDRELTVALTNPQTLGSDGRTANKIWLSGTYSIKVENSAGDQKYIELDNGTDDSAVAIFSLSSVSGANTIVAISGSSLASYTANQQFVFETVSANTGPVTLNVDSIGAGAIVKNNDQPLVAGDFAANQEVIVVRNATNTNFELVNQNAKVVNFSEGTAVVSAATIDPWSTDGNTIHITGTTAITSLGTAPNVGARRTLIFDAAVTLTHNASTLVLPNSADFTTSAGDELEIYADTVTLIKVKIVKKSGQAVVSSGIIILGSVSGTNTITATADPTITAYEDGRLYSFKVAVTNTGTVTVNIDSLGAISVVQNAGAAIVASEWVVDKQILLIYNSTLTQFDWVNHNNRVVNFYEADSVTAAATTDIWGVSGNTIHVTGTTTITSFGTAPTTGAMQRVVFDGALLLTHSTNLNLPSEQDFTVEAGDVALVYADNTSQFDVFIMRTSGEPIYDVNYHRITSPAGTDTYTGTFIPGDTAYRDGHLYVMSVPNSNTGTVTVNFNSIGAVSVVQDNGLPIQETEWVANKKVLLVYNSANTQFQWINQSGRVVNFYSGTTTVAAATTNIWVTNGNSLKVSGSTTITSFGTAPGQGARRRVTFTGSPLLTHSTNLFLPGQVDYQASPNDVIEVHADSTTQHDVTVIPIDGTPIIVASTSETVTTTSPSATKPMTPFNFAFTSLPSTDGYFVFPSGFTIEWGDITIAAASGSVTFPIALSSVHIVVTSVSRETNHWTTSLTTTGFTVNQGDTTSTTHRWIATGRITS